MDAILLSAGEGLRLRPLTLVKPKCLLPVFQNDIPMLEYWIKALQKIGIQKIFINVDYLKEQIIEYVKNFDNIYLCNIMAIPEAIFQIKTLLGNKFLAIYSDTYIPYDWIKSFYLNAEYMNNRSICIGIEKIYSIKNKGAVKIDSKGLVKSFIEKPDKDEPGYVWVGIALIHKNVFDNYNIETIKTVTMEEIFQVNATGYLKIKGHLDIGGSLEDYYNARKLLKDVK